MKTLCIALTMLLATTATVFADSSSFSETQSPDDQLFHIDVGASYLQVGQPPRDQNSGVGTIKISLPGSKARFDPALAIDQSGFTCSVVTSTYGEPGAGYLCSSDGQVQGAGLAFPNAVTVHLLSQNCYAPPPEGSAQPAVAEVWAAPGDPGTPPDASFPLYGDPGCDSGLGEPPVDVVPALRCLVPKLQNLTVAQAKRKLKSAGCRAGKLTPANSKAVKKGRVIKQSAKPGKKLKLNSTVKLTVSLGRRP